MSIPPMPALTQPDTTPSGPRTTNSTRPASGAPDTLKRLVRSPRAVIALIWLVGITLASALAPVIAQDPQAQDLNVTGAGPSIHHLLGTDELGRDVLSRILHGGVPAIEGTLLCVAVAALLGVASGLVAGFAGGPTEMGASFLSDVLQTMPAVIVILLALSLLGSNLDIGMIVLGVLLAPSFYHLARTGTKAIRRELFVDAAKVSGLSRRSIILTHILPNIRRVIVVQATVTASIALLLQAGLSFLGQGPPPPAPEWGSMVQEGASELFQYPWLIFPTGGVIILTALAFNLLGDAVNDLAGPQTASSGAGGLFTSHRRSSRQIQRRATVGVTSTKEASAVGSSTTEPLLAVDGITVTFGGPDPAVVVDDVSLEIAPGEAVALVGESGSGKTMTALAIMGLLPAGGEIVSGSIRFDGQPIHELPDNQMARLRGSQIGLISQEPLAALDPSFTIASQISEPLRTHARMSRSAAAARAVELLGQVGIARASQVAESYPHELSGGMAQRVAIAIALAGKPRLLIADEPTTALDVTVQAEILDLLRQLQMDTGVALLVVTHDWGVVADIASSVAVMYASQIVERAKASEIFPRPLHPYSRALLQSMPRHVERDAALPTIPGAVPLPSKWPNGCRFHNRCAFATEACAAQPIALSQPEPGRLSRCIHIDALLEASA